MEYQKIISNQPSKFRTKHWVEINDESREALGGVLIVKSNLKPQC